MNEKVRQRLAPQELLAFASRKHYIEGEAYLWIQTFGWACVGFYICHDTPLRIRVAHANHFRAAGVDYGRFAQEGPPPTCEWRYEGNACVREPHVIRCLEYFGEVPRGRIIR